MDDKWSIGPVSAWRIFGLGVCVGFFLDIVSHTIDLYWSGTPVTLTNIYLYGARTGHAEAWIVSSCLVLAYGAYVLRQAYGTILARET